MDEIMRTIDTLSGRGKDCRPEEECRGCGDCCSLILPITRRELKTMRKYAKKHGIKPIMWLNKCPYLSETRECMVYEVRPLICRGWNCRDDAAGTLMFQPWSRRLVESGARQTNLQHEVLGVPDEIGQAITEAMVEMEEARRREMMGGDAGCA